MPDYELPPDYDTPVAEERLRYFAVISHDMAFGMDFFPGERAKYRRELAGRIVGEFATYEEALAEAGRVLVERKNAQRQSRIHSD